MEETKSNPHSRNNSNSPHPMPSEMEFAGEAGAFSGGDYSNFRSGGGIKMSMDDSGIPNMMRDTSDSYPTLRRVNSANSLGSRASNSRRSFDDFNASYMDARMQKIVMAEAAIREEMFKECTFRPKIKPLPTAYGPLKENGTPFVIRVNKWNREKEMARDMKQKIIQKTEESECTFQPKISKYSAMAVKEIRGDMPDNQSPNDRLFFTQHSIAEQKKILEEEEKARKDEQFAQECTFQPKLLTKDNPQFQHVHSKFLHAGGETNSVHSEAKSYQKDLTFTPKVNKLKPNMTSAKLYCQSNVVDRLTRPIANPEVNNYNVQELLHQVFDDSFETSSKVMDTATFLGNLSGAKPPNENKDANQTSSAKVNKDDVNKFYERQQIVLQKKEERVKQIEKQITPKFAPKITAKAEKAGSNMVDFLSRNEREIQRRKLAEQQKEVEKSTELEFRPNINKKAQSMRRRTLFELSKGDLLRKETQRKMLQLQIETEQMQDMTFQPKISNRAKEYGKSLLKLNDDPSKFLEWQKQKEQQKELERIAEKKRREEEELAGCTFSPKTTECPAYVKRIAESINKMKQARNSSVSGQSVVSSVSQKPEWR